MCWDTPTYRIASSIGRSVSLVYNLVAVQIDGDVGLYVKQNKPFKELHKNWAIILKIPICMLFGHGVNNVSETPLLDSQHMTLMYDLAPRLVLLLW